MEKCVSLIILLFGVTMFSFIIGQLLEIIMNINTYHMHGNHKDLTKWISLLSKYNNGNPLEKSMISEIENFFDYYWQNNRMGALVTDLDILFLNQLPTSVKNEIFIDYLYVDFCYKYKKYFNPGKIKF